jgi:protein-disulfide isomerase
VQQPRSTTLLGLAAGLVAVVAAYGGVGYIQNARQETAIAAHADELFRSPASFVAGNPNGDVTVVAFFDYNCPYCRAGAPDLKRLLSEDGRVRLVLKELPMLGTDSENVARIAQAAIPQGKYLQLYDWLIGSRGRMTKERALEIASELGLDTAKLEADMHSPQVEQAIAANKQLADRIGVDGVPFYLVGDRPLPPDAEDLYTALAASVADTRQHGCEAAC